MNSSRSSARGSAGPGGPAAPQPQEARRAAGDDPGEAERERGGALQRESARPPDDLGGVGGVHRAQGPRQVAAEERRVHLYIRLRKEIIILYLVPAWIVCRCDSLLAIESRVPDRSATLLTARTPLKWSTVRRATSVN